MSNNKKPSPPDPPKESSGTQIVRLPTEVLSGAVNVLNPFSKPPKK
jgi:hypothetical protein